MVREFGSIPADEAGWPDGPPDSISDHVGEADPHTQYAQESALGTMAALDGAPSDDDPVSMGTFNTPGDPGVSADFSRADHVHENVRLGTSVGQACEGNDPRLPFLRGSVALVSGTATVTTNPIALTDLIFLTPWGTGSSGVVSVTAITTNTSFVITSSDGADTRTINYVVFAP